MSDEQTPKSLDGETSSFDMLLREIARADPPPAKDPLLGRTLAHFRIHTKLGEGGMGVVYQATDEKLQREVALKVLPDGLALDVARRKRFLREARAAAAATHACIAAVHEIGEADGRLFIAMELIRGTTLRDRMRVGLTVAETIRMARDIARGLAKAHERGVVHRDLKPDNVMLTEDGEVKILDFGLAKFWQADGVGPSADGASQQQLSVEGQIMGTPAYMSPEQARGQVADARSDVFSFGAMLYEMLSGKRPFVGEVNVATLYSVMHHEPVPVEQLNPSIPAAVAEVVQRCLAKDRELRFASGRELLRGFASSEPTGAEAVVATASAATPGLSSTLTPPVARDAEPVRSPIPTLEGSTFPPLSRNAREAETASHPSSPAPAAGRSRRRLLLALPLVAAFVSAAVFAARTTGSSTAPAPEPQRSAGRESVGARALDPVVVDAAVILSASASASVAPVPSTIVPPARERRPTAPTAPRASQTPTATAPAFDDGTSQRK